MPVLPNAVLLDVADLLMCYKTAILSREGFYLEQDYIMDEDTDNVLTR